MNTPLVLLLAGLAAGGGIASVTAMEHLDLASLGGDAFASQRCHDAHRGKGQGAAALQLCVARKGRVDPGEAVQARLRNTGSTALEGELVAKVVDLRTKELVRAFEPRQARLEPGETLDLAWDQRDDAGQAVPEGEYKLKVAFSGQRLGVGVCVGQEAEH